MKRLFNTVICKNYIFTISRMSIFFLFLLMLVSMRPWFAWNNLGNMIFALSICFLFLRCVLSSKNYSIKNTILIVIFLAFLVYFMVRMRHAGGLVGILNAIRAVLVLAFVMAMSIDEKKQIVTMTTNLYAWIVGISMLAYLFVISGIDMPYSTIEVPDNLFYRPFLNYRLFIVSTQTTVFFQRFQSIFTEPGHLSMISALLLYVNQYELKKKSVLIIFVSVLMTLSLSGYLLMIFGYLIQIVAKSNKMYRTVLKIVTVTALLVSIGLIYYSIHPDSMFSRLILSRLELDEERGIRGNNRVSDRFDHFYETHFLASTENILWGMNLTEAEHWILFGRGGENSHRVFLLNHGVISLVLLFLMYFCIVAISPSKLGFGFLILYCLSFLQRIQTHYWEITLVLFMGAIQYFHTKSASELISKHKSRI